jgi:hypothetical protein
MWTTIAYKDAFDGNNSVRIYDDSTEKSFDVYDDAMAYSAYLSNKGLQSDVYEVKTYASGELDIDELKRQDALSKLTEEEKKLLGING